MGNLDLGSGHMSTEGSLAFQHNECHAYSMRGSMPDSVISCAGVCAVSSRGSRITGKMLTLREIRARVPPSS